MRAYVSRKGGYSYYANAFSISIVSFVPFNSGVDVTTPWFSKIYRLSHLHKWIRLKTTHPQTHPYTHTHPHTYTQVLQMLSWIQNTFKLANFNNNIVAIRVKLLGIFQVRCCSFLTNKSQLKSFFKTHK